VRARPNIHEFRADRQLIAATENPAGYRGLHAQVTPDADGIDILSLEPARGCPRDHPEPRELGQPVRETLAKPSLRYSVAGSPRH